MEAVTEQMNTTDDLVCIGGGSECAVFLIDDNVVLKAYEYGYSKCEVEEAVERQRIGYEEGIAPKVLSGVIEVDDSYGYISERADLVEENQDMAVFLATELGQEFLETFHRVFGSSAEEFENNSNVGFIDGKPVALDFGEVSFGYVY